MPELLECSHPSSLTKWARRLGSIERRCATFRVIGVDVAYGKKLCVWSPHGFYDNGTFRAYRWLAGKSFRPSVAWQSTSFVTIDRETRIRQMDERERWSLDTLQHNQLKQKSNQITTKANDDTQTSCLDTTEANQVLSSHSGPGDHMPEAHPIWHPWGRIQFSCGLFLLAAPKSVLVCRLVNSCLCCH
jgi:hypothetical protein